jgi:hypothetical protein
VYDGDFVAPSPGATLPVDVPGVAPACVGVGIADDAGAPSRVGLRRVRPFPARELALALAHMPSVAVDDPWPDALERGWLTTRVALALRGTTTPFYSNEYGTMRIDLAWNEPTRTRLASEVLHTLALLGVQARAQRQSPWFVSMKIPWREGTPQRVILCEVGALGLWAVLADVGAQTAVVLLGAASEHDRGALEAHCSQRGATFRHVPEAWLACLNS